MHFPFVVYWKDMCIALFTHADKVLLSGVSSIRWCANSTPLVFWVQMAYRLVVSSLSFSSLMLYSGHKIKEKKSWALLSFPSLVLINTVNLQESAWRITLPPTNHFWFGPFRLTHHILQGQTHSHTHYIHVLLDILEAFAHFCAITGTASVNTLQEFALGSPASPGATQLKLGRGTCP